MLLLTFILAGNITVITISVSMTALALVLFEMLRLPYTVTFVFQFMTSFLHNLALLGLVIFYTSTAESQAVAGYVSISMAFFSVSCTAQGKTQLWKRSVEWLTSFKTERRVEDNLTFLDYICEEN